MSIQGIKIDVTFTEPRSFTDEWLENFYTSLEQNAAILSVDVFLDEEAAKIGVLFGIDCPDGLDIESLVPGIAEDALDKAIGLADGDDGIDIDSFAHVGLSMSTSRVEVFA